MYETSREFQQVLQKSIGFIYFSSTNLKLSTQTQNLLCLMCPHWISIWIICCKSVNFHVSATVNDTTALHRTLDTYGSDLLTNLKPYKRHKPLG